MQRIVNVVARYVFIVVDYEEPPNSNFLQYYSALAPLPLPAQPPLWRSPPTTPQKKRKYDTFDSDEEPENTTSLSRSVKQHVQKVSRHRRRWEAPKTPPGYWDIGFPDTQQTEEINKRAREMHADKLRNAEAEAR